MPEKSGMDAVLCAPRLAGAAAVGANCCAEAKVIAANVASNRKCRCIFMSTTPPWFAQVARTRAVAVPPILYQNRNGPAASRSYRATTPLAAIVASRLEIAGLVPAPTTLPRLRWRVGWGRAQVRRLSGWPAMQGATAFGRCVGNATRATTLDSMREVPTWPHAPPAPWPRHHPGVGGDAGDPRGLFRADCNLHDEARAEFAALIKFLEIGEECLPDRFLDEFALDEHRHLTENESAPKRVRVQVVSVGQQGPGPHILQARGMEMAGEIGAEEILIACIFEDRVERVQVVRMA